MALNATVLSQPLLGNAAIALAEIEAEDVDVVSNQAGEMKLDDVDKHQDFTKISRVEEGQNPQQGDEKGQGGVARTRTPISSESCESCCSRS